MTQCTHLVAMPLAAPEAKTLLGLQADPTVQQLSSCKLTLVMSGFRREGSSAVFSRNSIFASGLTTSCTTYAWRTPQDAQHRTLLVDQVHHHANVGHSTDAIIKLDCALIESALA